MNYFERLVRRALLQPATAPGAALADPFENEDAWPLEAVAAVLAQRETDASVTAERVETLLQPVPSPARPIFEASQDIAPTARQPGTDAPSSEPVVPAPPSALEVPAPARALATVTPGALPPAPAPIDIADRFMRELGVPVPDRVVEARIAAPESERTVAMPTLSVEKPAAPLRAQSVSAPIAPLPEFPPVHESLENEGGPASVRTDAAERERTSSFQHAPTVVETRQVVVVDHRSNNEGGDGVSGGGSPRFGLGQL